MSKPVRQPGPDHPISIDANFRRVIVEAGDVVLADTRRALTLRESTYPPVQYIPREDVDMTRLVPSDHTTHCPYKGDASYFDVPIIGDAGKGAVWSYVTPNDAVAAIGGHLAFYADRFRVTEK